ncbi:efflux RND transporter periplasmic adaptor subunit [Actinokineospora xionganensis]|uniref:Efflux RND transporter periplasmic adaptor subunit n=1 Tax=Actinokineospora xionganensis TaxID=2684470 RepID=A0ABR7LCM7_9PSEU|nr:efflux RND transporter periplasmic adaptor subunit [Actinokineospora xionganensis]MBC6450248.1 efflux RND transporter periplasmic adaptor subunit [Actinokineospora xionganensis]
MVRKRPFRLINVALVVVLLAAGVTAYFWLRGGTESASATLRTVTAGTGSVVQTVSASGTLESASSVTADFTTAGTVAEILVKVGDTVTAGQALAKLDAAEVAASVDIAEDERDAAQYNLTSAQTKLSDTVAQGADATQARASVKQQEAALKQKKSALAAAQKKLTATTLTAPAAGTVVAVNGSVGGTAGSGGSSTGSAAGSSTGSSSSGSSAFIQISDLTTLLVRTSLAEVDVAKVKVGQAATITVNAIPGSLVAGTVAAIDPVPSSSNNVVTFGATLTVPTLPDGARAGQTASVSVTVSQVDDVVVLSSVAVQTTGGASTVTLLVDGVETRRAVTIGVRGDSTVEVTSGVSVGDQVVIPGAVSTGTRGGTGGTSPFGGGGGPGGGVGPGAAVPGGAGTGQGGGGR